MKIVVNRRSLNMNENIVNSDCFSYLIVHIKCVELILLSPPPLYAGEAGITYAFGINMPARGRHIVWRRIAAPYVFVVDMTKRNLVKINSILFPYVSVAQKPARYAGLWPA